MRIYKIAWKFIRNSTYICELCSSPLIVTNVIDNPNHHFNPGQLFECQCKKSKVWANSVRYPETLKNWCDGKEVQHHEDPTVWGFCNDQYCPYCWGYWQCLENGYEINGKYVDKFGCASCKQNQFALLDNGPRLGERDGQEYLANWYKGHQQMWRNKA